MATRHGRQEPGEPYRRVTTDEAREMLNEDQQGTVVVDVRQPDEWRAGHVAGAMFIPVDSLPVRVDELPKDKTLLFICAQGVRSGLAAEIAASMGYDSDRLYNIEDGTPAWIQKGYPTEYGD